MTKKDGDRLRAIQKELIRIADDYGSPAYAAAAAELVYGIQTWLNGRVGFGVIETTKGRMIRDAELLNDLVATVRQSM